EPTLLKLHDMIAAGVELDAIEAILRARLLRVGTCHIERGRRPTGAEDAVRRIAGCRDNGEQLAGGREDIDARFVAGPGSGVDASLGVERHAVDAATTAEIVKHMLLAQRAVSPDRERHELSISLWIIVGHIDRLAIRRDQDAVRL